MPRTNGETLLWHQEGLLYGRVSEEKFKSEAIKFFGLTQEESCKSKQYFKKDIQDFINKHVNLQNFFLREYLEENGGIGKHHETPPDDFKTEVQEVHYSSIWVLLFYIATGFSSSNSSLQDLNGSEVSPLLAHLLAPL